MNDDRWSAVWAIAVFANAFESPWARGVAALLSCAAMAYWTFRYETPDV